MVAADWFHGPLFSIDPRNYANTEKAIAPIFQPDISVPQIEDIASRYSIAALFVDSSDPVWTDRQSWIWRVKPDLVQDSVRVFLINDLRAQRRSLSGTRARAELGSLTRQIQDCQTGWDK